MPLKSSIATPGCTNMCTLELPIWMGSMFFVVMPCMSILDSSVALCRANKNCSADTLPCQVSKKFEELHAWQQRSIMQSKQNLQWTCHFKPSTASNKQLWDHGGAQMTALIPKACNKSLRTAKRPGQLQYWLLQLGYFDNSCLCWQQFLVMMTPYMFMPESNVA